MTLKDCILTYLLLLIPIANVVLMFVWAFNKDVSRSKKNNIKPTSYGNVWALSSL